MTLAGKLSAEVGIHANPEKVFNILAKQLHHLQNVAERIHGAKLHEGDDWHTNDSIKQWTYTIAGEVLTCHESIESIDEKNKTITFKLFGEDIEKHFKVFKLIVQAIDKNEYGSSAIKCTIEYEKISKDVHPPFGYLEFCNKCVEDVDEHLLKADEIVN
ncbi:hypothetical protein VNO78_07327 [Psophocarpus tetragonolobus]|uniref:Bet v I/Major latex protein domain-containing protein n=1 Tax=Psophocarpus tetragonolobus TaxID=3891 RepID=A0AAN9SW06_PSOTE